MNILHLASSYGQNKIYSLLIRKIYEKSNSRQIVYVPVRTIDEVNVNKLDLPEVTEVYSLILKKRHRLLYGLKVLRILKDLRNKVVTKGIELIHAHYLFADGGAGFYLSKQLGIPLVVTVRNVDVNIFLKYMFFLRPFGRLVLKRADRIIVLSGAYKERLLSLFSSTEAKEEIEKKIRVIPNGIDQFWHNHVFCEPKYIHDEIKFIFIGAMTRLKNLDGLIRAISLYREETGRAVKLDIIGGSRDEFHKIYRKFVLPDFVSFHGRISSMAKIADMLREAHIFTMASHAETFGLVYAEALSQGCPVIYTQGEGFDLQFPDGFIGYAVDSRSPRDIARGISRVVIEYERLQLQTAKSSSKFNWEAISVAHLAEYEACLANRK